MKNGAVVAEAGRWAGLPDAVAAVPEARPLAESAVKNASSAAHLNLAARLLLIAGPIVATGLLIATEDSDSDAGGFAALGALAGALVGGPACLLRGQGRTQRSWADALDAVNVYNSITLNGRDFITGNLQARSATRSAVTPDTVEVREGGSSHILDGTAKVNHRRFQFRNTLEFEGVVGVSPFLEKDFDRVEVDCRVGRIFYISTLIRGMYAAKVLSTSGGVVLLEIRPL